MLENEALLKMIEKCRFWFYTPSSTSMHTDQEESHGDHNGANGWWNDEEMSEKSPSELERMREDFVNFWVNFLKMNRGPC